MTTTVVSTIPTAPDIKVLDFDEAVVSAFTDGDCWALAQTVGLAYGFPVVTANLSDNLYIWNHAGNRLPDGTIMDIEGVWTEAAWLEYWAPRAYGNGTNAVFVSKEWTNEDWAQELREQEMEPEFTETMDSMMYAYELVEAVWPDAIW